MRILTLNLLSDIYGAMLQHCMSCTNAMKPLLILALKKAYVSSIIKKRLRVVLISLQAITTSLNEDYTSIPNDSSNV